MEYWNAKEEKGPTVGPTWKQVMDKRCNLTRNYSIASLLGIGLVAFSIVYFYQTMAVKVLMEREGEANGELAKTIANTVWTKYADYVLFAGSLSREKLATLPVVEKIRSDILHRIQGLRVVNVKIYDLDGLVVFSTEAKQIGKMRGDRAGFVKARSGGVASEIILQDTAQEHEVEYGERNLIATYVPVQRNYGQPVEGVFEIYSDVTPLLQDIQLAGSQILAVTTTLMLLLYLSLLVFVRSAHRTIEAHEAEWQNAQRQRLDYLEHHDELSGLLNRKGLLRQMWHYEQRKAVTTVGLGVVTVRLTNLDIISGSMGHDRLMQLLRLAGERIGSCATGNRSLCHLEKGTYVLLVENLLSDSELVFVAEKLGSLFVEPFDIGSKGVVLTLAVGFDSCWGGKSNEALLNSALLAMAECEEAGQPYLRYEPNMEKRKLEHLNLELDIGQAVRQREFMLHYQPKVDVATGRVSGMEGLLRWQHPQKGLVFPDNFISLIERRGYIVELGGWVLQEACQRCRQWRDELGEPLRVAVNVSLKQLVAEGFVESVTRALQQSGLPPQALELELTESILAEDLEEIGDLIGELRQLGVVMTIDDFGTGYSSLSYLTRLPFDVIKIDRSFVQDMMHRRDHAVLTSAIITMAKSLELQVVAEGVESAEQLAMIRDMGCDEIQGYYFSPAVGAEEFCRVAAEINGRAVESLNDARSYEIQNALPAES